MIKLVAFDWNGTIFADTKAILEGVNRVLELFNIKPTSLINFQRHFDVPVRNTYIALGIPIEKVDKRKSEIAKVFHSSYEPRVAKVRTRAWVRELLAWLSSRNIRSVIFSNHIDEPIRKQLRRLNLEHYFSTVLANSHLETAFKERAKQNRLENFLKSHNLAAEEILIVGDTIEEIEIGKKLGVLTAAITHGNCSIIRLKKAKPDFLIGSLKEVISIIKKINRKS